VMRVRGNSRSGPFPERVSAFPSAGIGPAQELPRTRAGSSGLHVHRGFTLIEVHDDARVTKAKQDIRAYETALNLYRMDNFRYPTTEQGLQSLITRPADPNIKNWKEGGYVDGMKKDPWGNDYAYIAPGTRGEYDLYTLGADGQPGGEGPDADIGNWNIE